MEDDLIDQQDAFIEGQEEEIDIILLGEDPKMAKKKQREQDEIQKKLSENNPKPNKDEGGIKIIKKGTNTNE